MHACICTYNNYYVIASLCSYIIIILHIGPKVDSGLCNYNQTLQMKDDTSCFKCDYSIADLINKVCYILYNKYAYIRLHASLYSF